MHHEGLAPGTVVAGKYVVERPLGRGGMGAVYVVSHAHTGKRLAMKTLLAEFVNNADLVGRFLREAQVMGRLQHRHVVDVFDVGRDGDVLYIVMELLEGKPLSDLLHDSSLTLEEALVIMLRAMEGVSAAHAQGIVHRDLKPDNIFICVGTSGRLDDPRVLDFGISKLEDPTMEQLTRSGVSMGTPYYMSMEQLKGQRDLDQRVDVYALGVILYEAIAGNPPFVADSISALAIKVLTTEPTHLGALRPDLPAGLADVVMKALARERDDRHRSVRQLIEALRPYVPRSAGLPVPEGQGSPLRTPRGASPPPPRVDAGLPPVHARGTGAVSGSSRPQTFGDTSSVRSSRARGFGWALPVVAVASAGAALMYWLGVDGLRGGPADHSVSGGSSVESRTAPETPSESKANVQTPTRVAPTDTTAQPVAAPAAAALPAVTNAPAQPIGETVQPAAAELPTAISAVPEARGATEPPAAKMQTARQASPSTTPESEPRAALRRGTRTPTATRAGAEQGRTTRRRGHRERPESDERVPLAPTKPIEATPVVTPAPVPAAPPAASSAAPPAASPAAPARAPRRSAEGRAGKLGSDEF